MDKEEKQQDRQFGDKVRDVLEDHLAKIEHIDTKQTFTLLTGIQSRLKSLVEEKLMYMGWVGKDLKEKNLITQAVRKLPHNDVFHALQDTQDAFMRSKAEHNPFKAFNYFAKVCYNLANESDIRLFGPKKQ